MEALSAEDLGRVRAAATHVGRGDGVTQDEIEALAALWEPRIRPAQSQVSERFAVVWPDGRATGVTAPRWLAHLMGLRHRAVEIALRTPGGLIVLQRRSALKEEWPGAFDMAVAGHVTERADGRETGFEEAAWKEISEEIGLRASEAETVLAEGTLTPVGDPYFCFEGDLSRNPPFLDAEVRQVFAATLSGEGLARVRFADQEVEGLLLVGIDTAWHILSHEVIASGLRYSLPRYLDWLERSPNGDRRRRDP